MDLLGRGLAVSRERTQLYTNANEPLALSSRCFRLPHCERRRGCPTAMEPSSSTLMCPWSFVKAGYLLLQNNCSSLGAAVWRTHCYEKSGVSCYEALSTTKGVFLLKHWKYCGFFLCFSHNTTREKTTNMHNFKKVANYNTGKWKKILVVISHSNLGSVLWNHVRGMSISVAVTEKGLLT